MSRGKKTNFKSAHPGAVRRLPLRTCLACRQIKTKRELVRMVRTPGGDIEFDVSGKKEGRGAYICPTMSCLEGALKGKQLERVFKGHLTPVNRERLVLNSQEILKEISG